MDRDRDRYFDSTWKTVILEMEGGEAATIDLSPSFWRTCTELRSAAIGEWLLKADVAPWARGNPPGVVVTALEDDRFSARLLKRNSLQQ